MLCALRVLAVHFSGLKPRLVTEQPQQYEIDIYLASKHRFHIKFEIRLARQAGVVAQDAQPQAGSQTLRDNNREDAKDAKSS